jgi:hypothetical protein
MVVFDDVAVPPRMSGVGPTVFLLPSSSVESRCSACADEGGIGRRTGGRRPARPARACGRRRGPRSAAGGRKHCRSRRRPKSDPLTRGAGEPDTPARLRPHPRGCRGRSSSHGAEEPLPRPASAGGERRELGRRGRRRVGLRACLRPRREAASRRREADRGAGGRRH